MIAFSLIVTSMTGSAQTPYDSEPIFLWVRGDLWQWNPVDLASAPVQVTTDGTISAPILSPDGAFIAYKAASPVGLDALSRIQTDGLIADFDLPADIALFAVADSTIVPITRQPADASLLVEGVADNALIRSSPVWLPDSLTLAYVEFAFGTTSAHLVIYDLASTDQPARTPLDASLPITGYPPQIAAGRGGIMLWQTGTGGETLFNFYGADGSFVARQFVPPSESSIETAVWVEQGDQSFPALLYTSGVWALFDQRSAAPIVTDLLPQLVARRLPAISYAVAFGRLDDSGFFWEAFDPMTPDAASVAFPGTPSRVTLSPSGRAIAFLGFPEFGAAAVYRDGELIAIPGTGSGVDALNVGALLWGETMWRVE
jgi:hypothetical protein